MNILKTRYGYGLIVLPLFFGFVCYKYYELYSISYKKKVYKLEHLENYYFRMNDSILLTFINIDKYLEVGDSVVKKPYSFSIDVYRHTSDSTFNIKTFSDF